MSSDDQRYKGFKAMKMDPKFRVSIQPSWRPETGAQLFLQFSSRRGMPVVKVLTEEAYAEKVDRIKSSDKTPVVKDELLGNLAMLCREATLNDQGKLLVPKDLSEKAGIASDSDVMLAGRGNHFEIWSGANFNKLLDIESEKKADDDLGIF